MEALRETLAGFGNAWNDGVPSALVPLYEPLQAEQNKKYGDAIKVEKANKYGPHERNRIDVYSPAAGAAGLPVVVFIHGGGLVRGDNDATPNIYANIGNYFAHRGCVACLATYRLALQGGHHPDGADDVAAALGWVRDHIASRGGDPARVFAMGQSAGGFHLFSALATGRLDGGLLRGAVLLSAPFTCRVEEPDRIAALLDWFQTDRPFEINGRYGPLALFRQHFLGTSGAAPRDGFPCELLLLVGEFEADEILEGTWEFVADYKKRFGKLPILEVMPGHNHVSYSFGLGLDAPEYEKVGQRLLRFVQESSK